MKSRKRLNKLPYLILLITHTSLLIFTFYKKKDRRRLFTSLISNIGLAYLFEFFVVNLLSGYRYIPAFFKNKQVDNVFGAILSQAIFIPFTALFITAFKLGWKAKLLFTLYFSLVEKIFVKWRIYRQYWWKTYYTSILLPIYFTLSDKWYHHLKKGTPAILLLSFYHYILVLCVNLLFLRAIKGNIRFGLGSFHSWKEHFLLAPFYSISLASFTTWAINKRLPWTNILSFRLIFDSLLLKFNWLKLGKDGIPNNLLFHLFMTFISGVCQNLVYKKKA